MAGTAGLLILTGTLPSRGDTVVTLGDSLTAEYLDLENFADKYPIDGIDFEATDYAKVTHRDPKWEAMSWVEVLGRLRSFQFEFGEWRNSWGIPRLGGFERNWAVPGAKASQYEEFMTTGFSSNPFFFGLRIPLDNQLKSGTDRVVIWLGANDLREKYGSIYSQPDASKRTPIVDSLKNGLIDDLRQIIDHVKSRNSKIEIVVGNLPDLGAAPKIIADFPNTPDVPNDSDRSFVTAATESINAAIATLADEEEIGLADIYTITKDLIANKPFYYGAIQFTSAGDADNNPHFLFTRDEFHPNTALQIQIARAFIKAFNATFDAGIPLVTQAESLKLLNISPREPYHQWIDPIIADVKQRGLLKDPDADGMTNLLEYAFAMQPDEKDAANLPAEIGGAVPGVSGNKSVIYTPAPGEHRDIDIAIQYKFEKKWLRVPNDDHLIDNGDGSFTAVIPLTGEPDPDVRLKVTLVPPPGASNYVATVFDLPKPATGLANP